MVQFERVTLVVAWGRDGTFEGHGQPKGSVVGGEAMAEVPISLADGATNLSRGTCRRARRCPDEDAR